MRSKRSVVIIPVVFVSILMLSLGSNMIIHTIPKSTQSRFMTITNSNYYASILNMKSSAVDLNPPGIVTLSVETLLKSPGYHSFDGNGYILSTSSAFMIWTPSETIIGSNYSSINLYVHTGSESQLYSLYGNNGHMYNFTIDSGMMNVSLHPREINITDSATIVSMFVFLVNPHETIYIGPDATTPPGGGGGGDYGWSNSIGANTEDGVLVNGAWTEEDIMSFSSYVAITYTTSSILSGSVLTKWDYVNTLNLGTGPMGFVAGAVTVWDTIGFSFGWFLPDGNTYGTTGYYHQNTLFYAHATGEWENSAAYAELTSPTVNMNIPQLTS